MARLYAVRPSLLLLAAASLGRAAVVPTPQGVTEVQSRNFPDSSISFKQVHNVLLAVNRNCCG
jgi:hypothetical protein